ncbi:MAG: cellulose synthase family protein [bacterium]
MENAILVIYGAALCALAGYGIHRLYLIATYLRHRHERTPAAVMQDPPPFVTVQLPVYNEFYVVERLIRAACAFDYPRDRFEVQVLDDSSDETVGLVRRVCAEESAAGVNISHVRRGSRVGFKAGALAHGLTLARGELIAIFDADFIPTPDFLRATVPHFADERLGLVQLRWEHVNRRYSRLTELQAILLDGHFVIEQSARHRSGSFFNFNGTAGVWRKAAICDAGGWQHDTLTEDLDLSYRAQLRGWRFLFVPERDVPAELPVEMRAFKSQQHRWAEGSIQTARKVLPAVLRSRLPLRVKLDAVIHLTSNFAYLLMLVPALLTIPMISTQWKLAVDPKTVVASYALLFVTSTISVMLFYAVSQRAVRRDWLSRLVNIPAVMALGAGLSVTNAHAVLRGLTNQPASFVRTPKYAIVSRGDSWRGKLYTKRFDPLGLIELALGAHFVFVLAMILERGEYLFVPFALLFACGFVYVGALSLCEHLGQFSFGGVRRAPEPATAARRE